MRNQRRDANEREIIAGLEELGYVVEQCFTPMAYDLLVGRLRNPLRLPLEVKAPDGKLRDSQAVYFEAFPWLVVRTLEEAVLACEKYL